MPRPPHLRHARPKAAPMGPKVELDILALGAQGDGLARQGNTAVFVPFTLAGEHVRARLGERRGDGIVAVEVEVLTSAPERQIPLCPHFGVCGGCSVQHLTDSAYATWKMDQLHQTLARAGVGDTVMEPLRRTPPHGRRRARLAARRTAGGVILGFNERRAERIIDISACPVLVESLTLLLPALRRLLAQVLPPGGVADVTLTAAETGADVLLTGRLQPGLETREALGDFAQSSDIARLCLQEGDAARIEPAAVRRAPVISLGGRAVIIPPGGFLQASHAGEEALVAAVLAGTSGAARVADLFAGSGTFSLPVWAAPLTRHVFAAESEAGAVDALTQAVRGEPHLTVVQRDLFRNPLAGAELAAFDAVILDPPRAGAPAQIAALAASTVRRIVSVSCNPITFARDARTLKDAGYDLERVTPVDQFLWSAHLELVGVFTRAR